MNQKRFYLERAMIEAERASQSGTYPIGAIIVDPSGEIIGRGYNQVYRRGDYTSHAEIEAIRDAGHRLMMNPNFEACTLYTTMEPCLMCSGAILLARIAHVIWVIDDDLYGTLRCLCHDSQLNASQQKEASGVSISESHLVSAKNCGEATVNSAPFQEGCVQSSLCDERVSSSSTLPAGYTEKIASLSILPARESDLAIRMSTLMNNWNAVKEDTLHQWMDGKKEYCEEGYIELMKRKI